MNAGAPLLSQYWALTKPRVVALIVFTAIIGMLLAIQPGDEWPWLRLLAVCAAVVLAGTLTAWLAGRTAAGRDAVLAVKAGAVDFLTKDPYLEDKLELSVDKVERILHHINERRRLEDENQALRATNERLRKLLEWLGV